MKNNRWIKLSDHMPNSDACVIAMLPGMRPIKCFGESFISLREHMELSRHWEWIPYSDETWKYLNEKS